MKKILCILGSVSVTSVSAALVTSCGESNTPQTISRDENSEDKNKPRHNNEITGTSATDLIKEVRIALMWPKEGSENELIDIKYWAGKDGDLTKANDGISAVKLALSRDFEITRLKNSKSKCDFSITQVTQNTITIKLSEKMNSSDDSVNISVVSQAFSKNNKIKNKIWNYR